MEEESNDTVIMSDLMEANVNDSYYSANSSLGDEFAYCPPPIYVDCQETDLAIITKYSFIVEGLGLLLVAVIGECCY